MPQFAFIAKDRMGNTVQGQVEAPNTAFAANQIGQMGYSLIELSPPGLSPSDTTPPQAVANQTQAMSPGSAPIAQAVPVDRTIGLPGAANLVAPSVIAKLAPGPALLPLQAPQNSAAAQGIDILQADGAKRRQAEQDLARMGMKPDEIRRLLDANANTTAPPPLTSASPLLAAIPVEPAPRNPKLAVQQKLAARTADLQSFAAQLQSNSAAARVQAVEAVSLDLPEFRPSTTQERTQAEAILREVYALRKREKYTEALGKCRQALDLVPADAAALEMFGDLLQGVARTNEAMAAYKRATEADPKRASAERKYGDLLVRQQQWSETDPEEVPKNPIAAAAFSLLVPGAGQIHNGQTLKGAVLLTCAAISMAALLFLMRNETPWQTSAEKPAHAPAATAREKHVAVDWTAQAPVIACVGFYTLLSLGSAIDAAKYAQITRRKR